MSNQEKQSQNSAIDLNASAQKWRARIQILTEKYIHPVIAGLKKRRAHDKEFLQHLEKIKPFVDTKATRYPSAWAYDGRGKSFVQIDLVFLLDIFHVAELAATSLIFSNIEDKLFERITIEYLSDCVHAFQKGKPMPPFYSTKYLDLDIFELDAKYKESIRNVADDAMYVFVTFVILHELGHIYEGHTRSDSEDEIQSQKDELDADEWAYRAMNEMDYSMPILEAVLAANGMLEISRSAAGYGMSVSTHPTWQKRLEKLNQFLGSNLPPIREYIHLNGMTVLIDNQTTITYKVDLLLSTKTDNQGLGDGTIIILSPGEEGFSNQFFGVVEYKKDDAYFYFRIGDRLCRVIVEDPKAHSSMALLEFQQLAGNLTQKIPLQLNHFGVGVWSEHKTSWGRVGDALEFDLADFYDRKLASLNLTENTRKKVVQLVSSAIEFLHRIRFAYAKGELSTIDIQEAWRVKESLKESQIQQLIGVAAYKDLKNAYDKTIVHALASRLDSGQQIIHQPGKPSRILSLRSTPNKNLSVKNVKGMLLKYDFYCSQYWSQSEDWWAPLTPIEWGNPQGEGIVHYYEKRGGGEVIFDEITGLMWQQSGSTDTKSYEEARHYIAHLNKTRFANYSDWRLPTLEEAMSLIVPVKDVQDKWSRQVSFFIDPIFSSKQHHIWTSDNESKSNSWFVYFNRGQCVHLRTRAYVRAVRSISR